MLLLSSYYVEGTIMYHVTTTPEKRPGHLDCYVLRSHKVDKH